MVRLCFFVNTRNATGRRLGGGINVGRTGASIAGLNTGAAGFVNGCEMIGCAGVPNAGDDDGTASCTVLLVNLSMSS